MQYIHKFAALPQENEEQVYTLISFTESFPLKELNMKNPEIKLQNTITYKH